MISLEFPVQTKELDILIECIDLDQKVGELRCAFNMLRVYAFPCGALHKILGRQSDGH